MQQLTAVISDRGSKYAVSGGPVQGRAGVDEFLKVLETGQEIRPRHP